jgi:hypothetical protein
VDTVHVAAGQTFDVSITILRMLQQQAGDFVVARDGFYETVMSGTVEIESTVFPLKSI